jgi:hypothetical protein
MRDLKISKVAGANLVQTAPLVVVIGLGMGVDEIIRTEFVEHGGIAGEHRPVAPILQSLDFVDCCVVFRHVVQPDRSRPQSKSDRHPGDNGNKCLGGCHSGPEAGVV